MAFNQRPIAIYYEHPEWFRPLFAALERRGLLFEPIRADRLTVDPSAGYSDHYSLFINRMSPSAWERGRGGVVFDTLNYLAHLRERGVPVINGFDAYSLEIAKGRQMALLNRLGLGAPKTRIVYRADQLPKAAQNLVFPLLVKPNIGGNGAGIQRFATHNELLLAVERNLLQAGPDGVFLLQEYHPPKQRRIVRAETLDGRFLYAIRLYFGNGDGFSICPADVCNTVDGGKLAANARQQDHGNEAQAEAYTPPPKVIAEIERIAQAAHLDIGGVEYLESERDDQRYYYDINALSNFIADPSQVLDFDPWESFVDSIAARVQSSASILAA